MQNFVCSERCIWENKPPPTHTAGNAHMAMNANIFPPVPAVTDGRKKNTPTRPIVKMIST
jgi:hypothetical protein